MNITNLVLSAVLTYGTEFAEKLELPLELPLITNQVSFFQINQTYPALNASVLLTNDFSFTLRHGKIDSYRDPTGLNARFPTKDHLGRKAQITEEEALDLARQGILKLGYSLEDFYMDLEPEVKQPFELSHFEFSWLIPNRIGGAPSIIIEIDASRKKLVYFSIIASTLVDRPEPDIPGLKELAAQGKEQQRILHPAYFAGGQLESDDPRVTNVIPKIKTFMEQIGLQKSASESSQEIEHAQMSHSSGFPLLVINLTKEMQFSYIPEQDRIMGFSDGPVFFGRHPVRLRDFEGEWNMSEKAAIGLVTNTVGKLGYNMEALFRKKPSVYKPQIRGGRTVPRYRIDWMQVNTGLLQKLVSAEVDAGAGRLVHLTIMDFVD